MLVYLHRDDLRNTELFCRNVMTHTDFQDVVENMTFWGCSISKLEGHRTSQALRPRTYPFLALLTLKRNTMKVVKKIEGKTNIYETVSDIHQGVVDNEGYLLAEKQAREEIEMMRALKKRQDESFLRCLKMDEEKERKKQDEREKQKQLEKQLQLEKQRKIDEEKDRIEVFA